MVAVFVHCFVTFLLLACSSVSRSETDVHPVLLTPMGSVKVCPEERATFTCRTIGGALLWRTTGEATGRVFNDESQASSDLGIFRLSVTGVRKEGSTVVEVNSTAATLNGVRPEDNNITLICLIATNFTSEMATLRVAGPPPAPVVTSITSTQSGTNNSSLLISWTMSDCAVQYVVAINSSDGSVYPNITTSDTNTTVTLPNGVDYCVTVAAVDAIDKRGQDGVPSCYDPLPTPTTSIVPSTITGTSSPTPSMSPMIDLTIIIIAVSVAALTGIIVVVVIMVTAVIILRHIRKRSKSIELDQEMRQLKGYTCQVFFQNKGKNVWSFTFAISHTKYCHEVKNYYYRDKTYYKSCDFHKVTNDVIITISNLSDEWERKDQPLTVSRTAVKRYSGRGEPPHCEMIVEAAEKDVTPSDLSFEVDLNGNHMTINDGFEAQNVIQCSVQVFYYYVNINWWQVIVAFFPTEKQKQVEQIYQDANTNSHQPLNFCGGNISVLPNNAPGWCIFKPDDQEHQQVKTTAIEHFKCDKDGKPPYCELTLKAVSDDVTPPDLSLAVTLFGANKTPKTIQLNRVAMTPEGVPRPVPPASNDGKSTAAGKYACQVFYYRQGINHWRAVVAFFPEQKAERVKDFFQDANIGPAISVHFSASAHVPVLKSSVKPCLINERKSKENGWTMTLSTGKDIYKEDIKKYTGADKPPHTEIIIKPFPDSSIPTDHLSQSIIITGLNPDQNTIVLKRALDKIKVVPLATAANSSNDVTNDHAVQYDEVTDIRKEKFSMKENPSYQQPSAFSQHNDIP